MRKLGNHWAQYLCMSFILVVANAVPVLATEPRIVTAFKDSFQQCFKATDANRAFAALEDLKRLHSEAMESGHDSAELRQMYQADIKDCTSIAEAFAESRPVYDESAQKVFFEAYQACLELEKRDQVAARTNLFCHGLFLAFKYR